MVNPVKIPLDVLRTVTRVSVGAVRHPLRTAGDVATQGRGLVATLVTGHRGEPGASGALHVERPVAEPGAPDRLKKQGDPVTDAAAGTATEPTAPAEPTTPAESAAYEPVVTEPSAVTGPGDEDEIPSPAVQPEDEDIEVTTPVGTTGAGPAVNPDTTESDLQQPGTEPLMDPSTTKRIKRETETLRKASDRQKE